MSKKVSFLDFERENLLNLVGKYSNIVENKKTDSNTIAHKQQIWERITTEYNRNPNVKKRLTKQLKRLWENTKARRKSKLKSTSTNSLLSTTRENPNATITDEFNSSTDNMLYDETDCLNQEKPEIVDPPSPQYENLEELLSPVISLRVRKVDEATQQQREMHLLAIQREQLQIKALEEHMSQQAELHSIKVEHEKELHQSRITQEKDLYLQKIRFEQELHQLRLLDYNKIFVNQFYCSDIRFHSAIDFDH